MGTVLGAFVARAGIQIDLVTRNAQHVAVLSSAGARVILPSGGQFVQKVNAMLPEQMSGLYDVIFLMTKQRENADLCQLARRLRSARETETLCSMGFHSTCLKSATKEMGM